MNISRRNFIKLSALAGAFAAANPSAFAQTKNQSGALNPLPFAIYGDPLYALTATDFANFVGAEFSITGASSGAASAVLSNVSVIKKASKTARRFESGNRFRKTRAENFTLSFEIPAGDFPQSTYQLWHPATGAFDLFLVPGGAIENNCQTLHAVINRI